MPPSVNYFYFTVGETEAATDIPKDVEKHDVHEHSEHEDSERKKENEKVVIKISGCGIKDLEPQASEVSSSEEKSCKDSQSEREQESPRKYLRPQKKTVDMDDNTEVSGDTKDILESDKSSLPLVRFLNWKIEKRK